jgi:hypothetical protein
LKELQQILSKVSRTWCEAATKTEDTFWRDPNRIITWSNCMFDTKTGDVLFDFNQPEFAQIVFAKVLVKDDNHKPSILYTNVPFSFQNLDIVNLAANTSQSNKNQQQEKNSKSSSSDKTSSLSSSVSSVIDQDELRRTHSYPVAPADFSQEVAYVQTNYSFMYLHDGRYIFILFGNNLACFDLISNSQRWHINIYEKRSPKYMFVNFFTQNAKYLYIGLPQDVFCIEKTRGTRFNLISMVPQMESTMSKKKRERVKDLEVDDRLVVIVTGDNFLLNTKIDFSDPTHYAQNHAVIMGERIEIENQAATVPSQLQDTNSSPIFQNHQLSRKKTLLNIGLDAPRLLLFDGENNFTTSATCKNKDRHNVLMKKSVSALQPYFCLINDAEKELRVVNKDGKRIHILSFTEKQDNDVVNFAYQGKRFMLDGQFGTANWSLIHPESGRKTDLSYLEVAHDRLFVVESVEGYLIGLLSLGVKSKRIIYWEQEEQKADPTTDLDQLMIRKLNMKWSTELLWKESYYKYELDGACRFYYDKKRNYFIITRTVTDSRRFLSKEQRLDIEVSVFQSETGKLMWKKHVECYTGNDPFGEKGFHIKTNNKQLFVYSYFVPVSSTKKQQQPSTSTASNAQPRISANGVSYVRAFNIQTGVEEFQHKLKRKEDLFDTLMSALATTPNNLKIRLPNSPQDGSSSSLSKTSSKGDVSQDSASSASDISPRGSISEGTKKKHKKDCIVQ